jgi:DNA (cytosine-5)-methyltransferase 1
VALHTLEICSGVGMLGEGLRAGLQYMGVETRTVCHIEREAYAAAVLAARMEEGSMDPAPVWSDLLTFDAAAWRGAVDCIVAGFPCQDLSLAGKRAGLDGKRSGLFFDILDIADACGARFLFLENVAGISSATASVVDQESASEYVGNYHAKGFSQVGVEDGRLLERAAARVMGELADRGWDAEWITLSASDVGASHGRARWFCWAWRMGHPGLQHQHLQQREDGAEHSGAGQPVAHAERAERGPERAGSIGSIQGHNGHGREADCGAGVAEQVLGDTQCPRRPQTGSGLARHARSEPEPGCCGLANPTGHGRNQGRPKPSREQGRPDATECGCAVANTSSPRCQGSEQRRTLHGNWGGGASTWTN